MYSIRQDMEIVNFLQIEELFPLVEVEEVRQVLLSPQHQQFHNKPHHQNLPPTLPPAPILPPPAVPEATTAPPAPILPPPAVPEARLAPTKPQCDCSGVEKFTDYEVGGSFGAITLPIPITSTAGEWISMRLLRNHEDLLVV